jgi:hypothetical protein
MTVSHDDTHPHSTFVLFSILLYYLAHRHFLFKNSLETSLLKTSFLLCVCLFNYENPNRTVVVAAVPPGDRWL